MRRVALLIILAGCGAEPRRPHSPDNPPPADTEPMAGTFEVSQEGAIIWLYAATREAFTVPIHRDPGPLKKPEAGARVATLTLTTTAAAGDTTSQPLTGLSPDTRYFYRLETEGAPPGYWSSFRTAPRDDADVPVHFLVGVDFLSQRRFMSPVFDTMRGSAASFMVSLGDWPYADSPWPGAVTLAEYRERHRTTRLRYDVRLFLERMPIFAVYDDHEVINDWDQAFQRDHPAQFAAAMRAWHEWFPVRGDRVYRKWRWGKHAELFLTDARRYRAPNDAPDDGAKSMLGAEQKAWLLAGLRESTATFKILFISVPLDFGSTKEHWNAFATERAALMAALAEIPGLVLLTGDQHWFAAHRHPNGLREYQFGPTQANLRPPPPPERDVVARVKTHNFGEIRVDPGPPVTMTVTARDARGALVFQEVLAAPATIGQSAAPP